MSATSIQIPLMQSDGFLGASRRISLAVRKNQHLAVLLVNVHNIEPLCASIGHFRVRELLHDFHNQLKTLARDNDTIERIGDQKFAILLSNLRNKGHAGLAAQKIERLAQDLSSRSREPVSLQLNTGVVFCPEQGEDPHELLRLAEIASLDGRRKNESLCFYEVQSAHQLFADWGLEARLSNALEAGDLEIHFQPKVALATGDIVGAEALMRWHEPEIGSISPEIFIDLAESTGQISELTNFAIQRACKQLSEWQGLTTEMSIAVNITPSIIKNHDIIDVLQSATGIWGIRPCDLTMEVTENALMSDPATSHSVLLRIREFGCRVSIDDFGTGYSSLAYLKKIPADELKIDRTFVMGMLTDAGDYKIVEHSINIAKSFGLRVVAEGIESAEVLEELSRLGCDYAQGFFISKPVPASDFEAICRQSKLATK
ncbi:MAG: GGDEF domain-containing phosphodiesterase [Woeseiaceae bacterium]